MSKLTKTIIIVIIILLLELIYIELYLNRIENIENNERGVVDVSN